MKKILFILLIITQYSLLKTQTISGYVSDAQTGECLIGAYVYDKNTKSGAITNAYGFFSYKVKQDTAIQLIFSYIGYQPKEIKFSVFADTTINIKLQAAENRIKEVQVKAQQKIEDRPEISTITIPIKQIKELPALGGEPDVLKVIQLMPGVQSGSEGSSGLYVRGGTPDQNLMLLDDVPIYYVNHLGGFVSTFNTDALSNVTLIKGGFPARYGSRLSSVVDIRMKDGNMKEFHGAGTIGLISTKLMLEGPIKKDTISYLVSFRRFMYDLLMRPATKIAFKVFTQAYTFYDFNAKINYKVNKKNRLYFSAYAGDDIFMGKFKSDDAGLQKFKQKYQWGNILGAFRWNYQFNSVLFSNTTLTYTRYRYKVGFNNKTDSVQSVYDYISAVNDWAAKTDFEYYPLNALKIRFGANGIMHNYTPVHSNMQQEIDGKTELDTSLGNFTAKAYEWNAYIENEFRIGHFFSANAGLRYSNYKTNDRLFSSFEPRISMNIKPLKSFSVKLAYSQMQQYVHLLTTVGTGMSKDYWVPSSKLLPPEKSTQYALGFAHTRKMFEFSLEGYYKTMGNLIAFKEGVNSLNGTGDWQSKVDKNGTGLSYGAELYVRKTSGRITGWTGYTWSKTTRKFAEQNNGLAYPFKYDRRHDFSIALSFKLNEHINFGATWVYGSGYPITLAVSHHYVIDDNDDMGYYGGEKNELTLEDGYEYGGKNAYRMRDYHRLDIGINFVKKKKWGERTWNISIYNLYNRQNPYYYDWDVTEEYMNGKSNDARMHLYQSSLFPFMPSFSYSFSF
jgi:hypothetical protein